jgi:sigma-E factor negative regulatory protein RseA
VKSKISALMDGELDQQDVSNIIEAIRKDDDLQGEWETYHLIGDTLRRSSLLSMNLSSSVSQKLKAEPTVLSPNISNLEKKLKRKVYAFSVAASVIAMVSAWLVMQNLHEPQQIIMAEQPNYNHNLSIAPIPVSSPPAIHNYPHPPIEINDYLFVHREFSPGVTMRGQVTNVNSVTEYHERYGR